jgi:hypothetical protein
MDKTAGPVGLLALALALGASLAAVLYSLYYAFIR